MPGPLPVAGLVDLDDALDRRAAAVEAHGRRLVDDARRRQAAEDAAAGDGWEQRLTGERERAARLRASRRSAGSYPGGLDEAQADEISERNRTGGYAASGI